MSSKINSNRPIESAAIPAPSTVVAAEELQILERLKAVATKFGGGRHNAIFALF